MAVVCDTCKTENRDHAMFCRGCAGKLPAFAATGPSALAALNASAASPAPPRRRSVKAAPAPGNPARLWAGLGVSLVLMAVGFAGWYAFIVRPAAQPAARVAAAPPPMAATRALPLTLLTPVEPVAAVESTTPAPPPRDLQQQTQPASPSPQHLAPPVSAPSRPVRVASAASSGGDPRTACSHLNFIAAARCEAAQCSKPGYARHPRCDAVRDQGRRDEARRNPLMAN